MQKRLQNVFMQFSEIENCTFEPETGTMNRNKIDNTEFVPGEFFTKMGMNLTNSNPKIYKQGCIKQARRLLAAGESDKSMTAMHSGFNIMRVFKHNNQADYSAWQNHKNMEEKGAFKAPGLSKLRDIVDKKYHEGEKSGKGWLYKLLGKWSDDSEQMIKDNKQKKAVYAEDMENKVLAPLYEEAWDILSRHINDAKEEHKAQVRKHEQSKKLKKTFKALNDQLEDGFEEGQDNADSTDPNDTDQRKIYKTIMCPMKAECSKVKMQRWPFSGLSSKQKFGKDCPYAHHPMEL